MKRNWFYRPDTPARLWRWGGAVLAVTVLLQLLIPLHGHFAPERVFAFHAVYGFASCVLMVLLAKWLGRFVKRPDDYYDD